MSRKIENGFKVKDVITGFEGIVIGITDWLYSCKRIGVRSQHIVDGKPVSDQWFDEQQLEIIEKSRPMIAKDSATERPGGNENGPSRQNHG